MINNKKANVSVMILIVATIALCIIALIAFYNYRQGEEEKINSFKDLRIIYYFHDDLGYYGKDLDYAKENYNEQSWFGKKLLGYRNYYPVVKDIKQEGSHIVLKREQFEVKVPL